MTELVERLILAERQNGRKPNLLDIFTVHADDDNDYDDDNDDKDDDTDTL
jgi:hypothetical protein